MEDHVPTPETCQRMKELGWEKETVSTWLPLAPGQENSHTLVSTQAILDNSAFFAESKKYATPAPLATEIMEELPDRMVFDGKQCQLVIFDNHVSYQEVVADPVVDRNLQRIVYAPAPVVNNVIEELSTMWIYLKENDLLPTQPDDNED